MAGNEVKQDAGAGDFGTAVPLWQGMRSNKTLEQGTLARRCHIRDVLVTLARRCHISDVMVHWTADKNMTGTDTSILNLVTLFLPRSKVIRRVLMDVEYNAV